MKVWVAQSPEFKLRDATNFYLLLTNSNEFKTALQEDWPQIRELRDSVRRHHATAYHKDHIGLGWWNQKSGSQMPELPGRPGKFG